MGKVFDEFMKNPYPDRCVYSVSLNIGLQDGRFFAHFSVQNRLINGSNLVSIIV